MAIASPVQASHEEICYVFADSGDRLGLLDRGTGVETPFPNSAGVPDIEAMELDPTTGILYAIDADQLGTLNQTTGVFTVIGTIGSGDPGPISMSDVDAMAFDTMGNLWAVNASGGPDELFRIDKSTGAIVPDFFGMGIDFLSVGGGFNQIDDIGIDPATGIMYGIHTTGSNDQLVTINTTTGTATAIGSGTGIADMEGMTFDTSGQLIGTTGNAGPAMTINRFYRVDKVTGVATFEVALGASGSDYESVTCMTQGIHVSDLELGKTVSDATPDTGDTITFTVTVTNQGEDDASGVEVVDQLPTGLTYVTDDSGGSYTPGTGVWIIGDLTAGDSVQLQIQALVVGTGTITNVAEVSASDSVDPDSIPNNDDGDQSEDDEDNAVVTVPLIIDLELDKSVDDTSPEVGDTVTFTVTVNNRGPDDATGVAVEDLVPVGYSNVTNISGSGSLMGSTVNWTGLAIAANDSIDLTFDADVDAPTGAMDEYLNVAQITAADQGDSDSTPDNDDGDQSEDDEDNASIATPPVVDLELVKTVDNTIPGVGEIVTFTVTVTNQGPDDATGVDVQDVVPTGYSGITNISGVGSLLGSTITWSSLSIAAGDAIDLTFDALVDAPTGAVGEYQNTSQVTASDHFDPDSSPNNDDGDQSEDDEDNAGVATPPVADLELVKTVNDTAPEVGDIVTFTVTVTNQGPDAATGVDVEDVVPTGYSSIANISGSGTLVGATITWSGMSIAAGNSVILTFDAEVQAQTGASAEYLNVAQVTDSDQFDSDSSPNNDDGDQSEDDEDNALVTPPEPGSVGGRLWHDEDRDGTQDAGEAGIDGVTIDLVDLGSDGALGGGDDVVVATTSTDADGDYLFSGLPPGNYAVVIRAASIPSGLQQVFDPDGLIDGMTPATVLPGETNENNDFGFDAQDFDLVLIKQATGPDAGGLVVWDITIRNDGPDPAPGPITLVDAVPDQLRIVSVTEPSGWNCSTVDQLLSCTNPSSLAVGYEVTIEVTTTATSPTQELVTNTATALANGVDSNPNNNSDTASVTFGNLPFTGFSSARLSLLAVESLLLGIGIVLAARRRVA